MMLLPPAKQASAFLPRTRQALLLQDPGMNRLLFGDNLKWLRDTRIFPDASVDLVYLDPPFNSNADYNVLFREASGESSQAQFPPSRTRQLKFSARDNH
jgi:16S rRNA G966 N2-methylase RsmD